SEKLGIRLKELFGIKNIHIIPNVADTRYFNFVPQQPVKFRILHASTMDHPKNVEGILAALEHLKSIRTDWECVMLGWDTPALRKLSTDMGLDDHVTWKGVVSYQEVAAEMKNASVFVLFSRYENQPCVILESLCSGLPVIATDVGGIPEIVNETNGILVKNSSDPQAHLTLLAAIIQCMEQRGMFDRKAIASDAQNIFSYDSVGRQFADLYDKYVE
ncbi:MAG TPA: glycosyltransferase family 4 protein, partial [Chitinophagaceae bacterium]